MVVLVVLLDSIAALRGQYGRLVLLALQVVARGVAGRGLWLDDFVRLEVPEQLAL